MYLNEQTHNVKYNSKVRSQGSVKNKPLVIKILTYLSYVKKLTATINSTVLINGVKETESTKNIHVFSTLADITWQN